MNSDEARDLLGEALEGELDAEKKSEFDAAVASDPELREELEAYRAVMGGVARLGAHDEDVDAPPNLLAGVQSRIRKRSRGRFFRDRFAEQAGPRSVMPLLVAILVALAIATTWVAMQSVIVIEAPSAQPDR